MVDGFFWCSTRLLYLYVRWLSEPRRGKRRSIGQEDQCMILWVCVCAQPGSSVEGCQKYSVRRNIKRRKGALLTKNSVLTCTCGGNPQLPRNVPSARPLSPAKCRRRPESSPASLSLSLSLCLSPSLPFFLVGSTTRAMECWI